MKTYWNGQELDTSKTYKINTIDSTSGKGNPWYVTHLAYSERFKIFSFDSSVNCEAYGMAEKYVVRIEEVYK